MTEVKRGDIFYADLSPVIGSKQDGYRPVLILQNDAGNKYSSTTIVAAVTSCTTKQNLPTQVKLPKKAEFKKNPFFFLEQIRTIDKTCLCEVTGRADEETMIAVDSAIAVSLGIGEGICINV